MRHEIIDISVPVSTSTPTWPGDPALRVGELARLDANGVRVSQLRMSVHTGTHIDAPAHYIENGSAIDDLSLDTTVGPCVVLDLSGAGKLITADDLARFDIGPGARVLLRTQSSTADLWGAHEFSRDFAHLTPDAAAFLAGAMIRCVGIDYLSIGGFDDGDQTHRVLLDAGVWIIEGLDLRGVNPGEYELLCLPLRLEGLEASPARAVLRRLLNPGDDFADDAAEWATTMG